MKPAAFVSGSLVEILTGILEEFRFRLLHSINSVRRSSTEWENTSNYFWILQLLQSKFCRRIRRQTRIPEPSGFYGRNSSIRIKFRRNMSLKFLKNSWRRRLQHNDPRFEKSDAFSIKNIWFLQLEFFKNLRRVNRILSAIFGNGPVP